jgi:hypothetical protein
MQLYLDKFLKTFNRSNRLPRCYNFKMDSISEIDLDSKLDRSHIIVKEKELFFFYEKKKIYLFS